MKYWFGNRIYDPQIDKEPREASLYGPFNTYQDAKTQKEDERAQDMEQTEIFSAESKDEAHRVLETAQFSTL